MVEAIEGIHTLYKDSGVDLRVSNFGGILTFTSRFENFVCWHDMGQVTKRESLSNCTASTRVWKSTSACHTNTFKKSKSLYVAGNKNALVTPSWKFGQHLSTLAAWSTKYKDSIRVSTGYQWVSRTLLLDIEAGGLEIRSNDLSFACPTTSQC